MVGVRHSRKVFHIHVARIIVTRTTQTQAEHKHKHKPRVNRDDASTSARSFSLRLCLRRPGSHVAYACAYACTWVVRVNQPSLGSACDVVLLVRLRNCREDQPAYRAASVHLVFNVSDKLNIKKVGDRQQTWQATTEPRSQAVSWVGRWKSLGTGLAMTSSLRNDRVSHHPDSGGFGYQPTRMNFWQRAIG